MNAGEAVQQHFVMSNPPQPEGGTILGQSSDFNNITVMANGRFMITKSIGKGSFGEIFQGLDTQTNKEVAIKMVICTLTN